LNCFYRVSVKSAIEKTLLSEKLCIKTVRRNLLKFYYVYLGQLLKCLIIKRTVFEFLKHNCDPQFQAWNYFLQHNLWLNAKPCKSSTYLHILHSEMMKSWHPPLPSFNPFVIVFYFLFRTYGKRAAPELLAPTLVALKGAKVLKAYADPGYEQPAYKYVQFKLSSWLAHKNNGKVSLGQSIS
jgi:hypothetical protein